MKFPAKALEKRLTEFQVAETADGKLLGAVGLQICERHGLIHSEAFTDFSVADMVRPLFWERLQSLAFNYGLVRLWTQEQALFWSRCGLMQATPEVLSKLPAAWQDIPGRWLTIQLREETSALSAADEQFALFMEAERQRTLRALRRARTIKQVATLIAFLLAIIALGILANWHLKNPQSLAP